MKLAAILILTSIIVSNVSCNTICRDVDYLNDWVVDVHVVLVANGNGRELAQQHLHRYKELQDARLLSGSTLVAVVAGVGQCLRSCWLQNRKY